MENVTVSIADSPNATDIQSFWDILIAHNSAQAGPSNFRKLYIMVRDAKGNVVATTFIWILLASRHCPSTKNLALNYLAN